MCDEEYLAKSETSFASNLFLMQTAFWFIFKKIIFLLNLVKSN